VLAWPASETVPVVPRGYDLAILDQNTPMVELAVGGLFGLLTCNLDSFGLVLHTFSKVEKYTF
tara:strand:- start:1583 stop:1771 length:189 start_codon:yes stop_codon:yes gene_type:complete